MWPSNMNNYHIWVIIIKSSSSSFNSCILFEFLLTKPPVGWSFLFIFFFATDIGNNQVNELTTCTLLSHSSATALNDQPIDPYSHISFCFSHTLQIKHFITIPHRERNNFDTNNKSTLLMIINMIINQTKISHYVCIM